MPSLWNPNRAKVQLRLSIQRLRTLASKKESINKGTRREIATDLETGREQRARVKTEGIILEDGMIEVLEILELFCELLIARFGLIEQTKDPLLAKPVAPSTTDDEHDPSSPVSDPGVTEALSTLIYAAPYLSSQLKELATLRDMLMSKFGRDFSLAAVENRAPAHVNQKVLDRLKYSVPETSLVDSYLREIAKAYRLDWESAAEKKARMEAEVEARTRRDMAGPVDRGGDDSDEPGGGGVAEKVALEPALSNDESSSLPNVPGREGPGTTSSLPAPSPDDTAARRKEDPGHLPNTPDRDKDYGAAKIPIQARIVRSPTNEKGPAIDSARPTAEPHAPPAAPTTLYLAPSQAPTLTSSTISSMSAESAQNPALATTKSTETSSVPASTSTSKPTPTTADTMDALAQRLMALRR